MRGVTPAEAGVGVVAMGGIREISAMVCEPCKRRKKACDKGLPVCGRCSRLLVKCSYASDSHTTSEIYERGGARRKWNSFSPIVGIVPGPVNQSHLYQTPLSSELRGVTPSLPLSQSQSQSSSDDAISQVQKLLDDVVTQRGRDGLQDSCEVFFRSFNWSFPIIEKDEFWMRFEIFDKDEAISKDGTPFSVIVATVLLVSFIFPQPRNRYSRQEELHTMLKRFLFQNQSTGRTVIELLQVGLLLTSWEWCQDLQQESWLTIGCCVRMAQVMGLHNSVKGDLLSKAGEKSIMEKHRRLWWCCSVLERIIQCEPRNYSLPCASNPPQPGDILPEPTPVRVREGLLLPRDISLAASLQTRGFTNLGTFSTTIQVTYLLDLALQHVNTGGRNSEEMSNDAKKLEVALQYFMGALIPGPGQSSGGYCGAFGLLANAQFLLHQNTLSRALDHDSVIRSKSALRSLTNIIILTAKFSTSGAPMDCSRLAFWSHRSLYTAALMHIKYGERNEDWQSDLVVLKNYFKQFNGRLKIFVTYLKDIEVAEKATTSTS